MASTRSKKLLEAALKGILAASNSAWWIKGPATFVAELSPKFDNLPDEQKRILSEATEQDLRQALTTLQIVSQNAALAAAGVDTLLERVEALRNPGRASVWGEHIRVFDAYIADRTKGFVGRGFVFDALDKYVSNRENEWGYFIIRGEPGIGKSALVAWLVRARGYTHHFNIALQGINTAKIFFDNVCAQLIDQFDLPFSEFPERYHESGAFLDALLNQASKRLDDGERLVVAIDALDEVRMPRDATDTNVLFLPPSLPANVFIVVTSRPIDHLPLHVGRSQTLHLVADSENNLRDVRTYLERSVEDAQIQRWIDSNGLDSQGFIEAMIAKSEGNFMYLYYVLPAISRSDFRDDSIDDLPDGLLDYYRRHWAKMRRQAKQEFDTLIKPVICVLGAAREAVPVALIAEWTKQDTGAVRGVLRIWREFLYEERRASCEKLYRLYHTSFQRFLQEEVDPGLKTYHRMIADVALAKIERVRKWRDPTPSVQRDGGPA